MWLFIYKLAYFEYLYITSWHHTIAFFNNIEPYHFKDLEGLWCRVTLNQSSTKGKEGFPLNKRHQRSSATTWIRGYDPLDVVSLILVERHPPIQSSPIKVVDQSSTSDIFLCITPRYLWKHCIFMYHACHYITCISQGRIPHLVVYFSKRWLSNKLWKTFKLKMPNSKIRSWT